ncbi:Putative adhesin [Fontibacillus panacisegetis]|uniref:Putative adhesin n=1 Tax=Fontibacillus panacisegetis TaxID=670482 RepID=A0A1G7GS61_9BACL|nr:DUF4097 family beta strand repeat-containing protein [Fontibacillus panacisegetis]SDE90956.1 Putative adhesin [Fontibacillus panacisegetis]
MKKHMTWISLLLLLVLIIAGIVGVNSLYTVDLDKEQSIEANGIENITISSDITDIYLSISPDNQIHAQITGIASKLSDYDVFLVSDNDHLHIQTLEKNAAISSLSLTKSVGLHIDLPANQLQNLTIRTKFGSVYAEQPLTTENFSFKSNLGGIYLDSYAGQELTVDSGLGNIQIKKLEGDASLTTSSGQITIEQWRPLNKQNKVQTNKGNIEVGITSSSQALSFLFYSNGLVRTDLDASFTTVPAPLSQIGMNRIAGKLGEMTDHPAKLEIGSDTGKIIVKKSKKFTKS